MVNSEDLANILIGTGVAIILFIALLFFFFVFIPMMMKKPKVTTHRELLNKFDNDLSESERNRFFNYFDRYIQNVKNSQMESNVVSPTSEFNF